MNHDPSLFWQGILIGAPAALILRRVCVWLVHHEEEKWRIWCSLFDASQWEQKRHCHLHLVYSAPQTRLYDQEKESTWRN